MKYFGGCDSGSTYTKCVIIDENGKMAANVTLRSRINSVLSAEDALNQAVAQVPELSSIKDLTYLVGTGYGRIRFRLPMRTSRRLAVMPWECMWRIQV